MHNYNSLIDEDALHLKTIKLKDWKKLRQIFVIDKFSVQGCIVKKKVTIVTERVVEELHLRTVVHYSRALYCNV